MENMEYYTRRLQCTEAEKDACLSTVVELLCLWRFVHKNGLLAIGDAHTYQEPDTFFKACLRDVCDWMGRDNSRPILEALFAKYLVAGDYQGGDFLRNVVASEGILTFLNAFLKEDKDWPSFDEWGERLSAAVQGYFGVEYREKVRTAIRREVQKWRRDTAKTSFLPEFDALAELPLPLCGRLLKILPQIMIALRYASGAVQEHVLSVLSPEERDAFYDEMELYSNLREIDVKTAQREILKKAEEAKKCM